MIFLKIVLIILALILAFILLLVLSGLFVDPGTVYTRDSGFYRFLLYSSTAAAVVLVRIRVRTTGLDKLPSGRFLLVSNHRSKFDPILTWHVMRKQRLAFISKPENFKIPVYGRIIRKCCFMPIDRDDPISSAKTVNHAAQLIRDDQASVAVYPEGTRNYGEGLLPFHSGLLRIAQKANVPVVVMTVKGTEKIHKNYPLHRTRVNLDVLEVIPAEEVAATRTNDLGERIASVMLAAL